VGWKPRVLKCDILEEDICRLETLEICVKLQSQKQLKVVSNYLESSSSKSLEFLYLRQSAISIGLDPEEVHGEILEMLNSLARNTHIRVFCLEVCPVEPNELIELLSTNTSLVEFEGTTDDSSVGEALTSNRKLFDSECRLLVTRKLVSMKLSRHYLLEEKDILRQVFRMSGHQLV
jgi:hypothetical protein